MDGESRSDARHPEEGRIFSPPESTKLLALKSISNETAWVREALTCGQPMQIFRSQVITSH